MYKNDVILDIRDDFTETLEYCDPIDLAFCQKRNIVVRAIQNVLRVLHRYYKNSLTDNCKFCMIYQTGVKRSRLILSNEELFIDTYEILVIGGIDLSQNKETEIQLQYIENVKSFLPKQYETSHLPHPE